MNILFIHQNFPAQFKHIAPHLAADKNNRVLSISTTKRTMPEGIEPYFYQIDNSSIATADPLCIENDYKILRAKAVLQIALKLKNTGFIPDVVYAHIGWGETLFIKDVWPASYVIGYFEYYYREHGQDVNFDPEFPISDLQRYKLRLKNTVNFHAFDSVDALVSPTSWQASTFPTRIQQKIQVVHEGINTQLCRPHKEQSIRLAKSGKVLTKKHKIITYVSRHLEPLRGFHMFMRSLPQLQEQHPDAHILILGQDGQGYGSKVNASRSFKNLMLDEVASDLQASNVHFLGHVSYEVYLSILQVSSVHVYLTYPFILSWSLLEAMACGCPIVASNTAPVAEFIKDRKTGLLVDFFEQKQLLESVDEILRNKELAKKLGKKSRKLIVKEFDVRGCLQQQCEIIEGYRREQHD